jgi:hypothetical protein
MKKSFVTQGFGEREREREREKELPRTLRKGI